MWYPDLMDDDTEPLSENGLMSGLADVEDALDPALGRVIDIIERLEDRFARDEDHQCPEDHQVHESLVQAKFRLAEALMWLRNAAASKLAAAAVTVVEEDPTSKSRMN